ncbi:UNVERIFIED_CONTAM: hypothetical protein Sradi_6539300 [Sesamum radiatum]|uniref:Transposase-associated domain-containing protein n=1 Tax=Sesamum radiatum TaxID=300843 RepID=A0AAW2JYL8_SESRA
MMYNKNLLGRASLTPEFENGVKTFIEWAKGRHRHMNGDKIRRPCQKCKNTKFGTPDEDYFESPSVPQVSEEPTPVSHVEGNYPQWGDEQHMDEAQKMVFYAAGLSYFASSHEDILMMVRGLVLWMPVLVHIVMLAVIRTIMLIDRFSNIVHAANQPLWDSCTQSQLGIVAELVDIKTDGHIFEQIYDRISQWANRILPSDHTLSGDYYNTKKLRLYSSRATAEHMTWHATHQTEEGSMCHSFDNEAWKHFDLMCPHFAEEPCNVQLGLCTDGFVPHGGLMWTMNDLSAYGMASEWSTAGVMGCLVCMDDTRAFHLQHDKKACYFDCHRQFLPTHHSYRSNKKAFTKNRIENMVARPGLIGDQIHDRVINISPTVEMSSSLPNGYGTDHKLMKKSIFWDLVHWSTLLIRHNLDAMHIEKNVFDNILNTIMDIKGRTKDNMNACRDLKIICNRPELELDERRRTLCLKRSIH